MSTGSLNTLSTHTPGPARGPEKGGGRKLPDPILKSTKHTRPPQKNQNSSVLGHFKMEIQKFIRNFRKKTHKIHNFRARTKFPTYFWVAENFWFNSGVKKGGGWPPPRSSPLARPDFRWCIWWTAPNTVVPWLLSVHLIFTYHAFIASQTGVI